jgi:hypothetical protein
MAYTPSDLEALDQAIVNGVLTVSFDGTTTTYLSFDELRARRDFVAAQLSGRTNRRARYALASFDDAADR